jgi:hypothetical protein
MDHPNPCLREARFTSTMGMARGHAVRGVSVVVGGRGELGPRGRERVVGCER